MFIGLKVRRYRQFTELMKISSSSQGQSDLCKVKNVIFQRPNGERSQDHWSSALSKDAA